MEGFENKNRVPSPNYQPGDKVWLSTKNIWTERPSRKLEYKQIGPFEIVEKVGFASYRLKLPTTMKIHPVIHSSLLQLDPGNPLPGQIAPPRQPVVVHAEDHEKNEWEVEEILDIKKSRNKLQYRVKWKDWPEDDLTWYPAANFGNSQELINIFHARYPEKPKPDCE